MPETLQEWLEHNARTPSALERMATWLAANEHGEDGTVYAMSKAQVTALLDEVDTASRARRLAREAQEAQEAGGRGAYAADEQTRNAWDAGYAAGKNEAHADLTAAVHHREEGWKYADQLLKRAEAAEQRAAILEKWRDSLPLVSIDIATGNPAYAFTEAHQIARDAVREWLALRGTPAPDDLDAADPLRLADVDADPDPA